jgi:hypothetical protein
MAVFESLATLTLSRVEKPGLDKQRYRAQLPVGRNDMAPEISTPRLVVSTLTGSIPSGVVPGGKQGIRSRWKIKSISFQMGSVNIFFVCFFIIRGGNHS